MWSTVDTQYLLNVHRIQRSINLKGIVTPLQCKEIEDYKLYLNKDGNNSNKEKQCGCSLMFNMHVLMCVVHWTLAIYSYLHSYLK